MAGGRQSLGIWKLNNDRKDGHLFTSLKNIRTKKSSLEHSALEIQWNPIDNNHIIYAGCNSELYLMDVTKYKNIK